MSLDLRSLNERALSFADLGKEEAAVFKEELELTLAETADAEAPEEGPLRFSDGLFCTSGVLVGVAGKMGTYAMWPSRILEIVISTLLVRMRSLRTTSAGTYGSTSRT